MSRIQEVFQSETTQPIVIPFIMAGDPNIDTTLKLMHALVAAGAKIIEIGMILWLMAKPYSRRGCAQ